MKRLVLALMLVTEVARAQPSDAPNELADAAANAAANAAQAGAYLPYNGQASLVGYRGYALIDGGYDGIRGAAMSRARAEVVLVPGRLSLFGGGKYGAPDISEAPRGSGLGGLRVQALDATRHGVDLSAAASYSSLGFSQLPAVIGELAVARTFGPLRVNASAAYGQSTREGDRYGSFGVSALFRIASMLFAGADSRFSTDLERDQDEPAFEPQYEVLGSALVGYMAPWLSVQARAGVRALQYRLQPERRVGPELGLSVATAL